MNLKTLTQLSHFVTLLFGTSFGMTMAIFIEYSINNAIITMSILTYSIILIMLLNSIAELITIGSIVPLIDIAFNPIKISNISYLNTIF